MSLLAHVRARREALRRRFDVAMAFERLEESCVPSYVHGNLLAAAVAWSRLASAARLYRRHAPPGPVLDFGAATGELRHLLGDPIDYHFVEADDMLACALLEELPDTRRTGLAEAPATRYAAVFALDSLEHNDDYAELLRRLAACLAPRGVFVLSGPTENALYRFGRRVAGFGGHYHKVDIHDIEQAAREHLRLLAVQVVPLGLPLFRVSAWAGPD